jgi:hypothetical protein
MRSLLILTSIIVLSPVLLFAEGRAIDTGTTAWILFQLRRKYSRRLSWMG